MLKQKLKQATKATQQANDMNRRYKNMMLTIKPEPKKSDKPKW